MFNAKSILPGKKIIKFLRFLWWIKRHTNSTCKHLCATLITSVKYAFFQTTEFALYCLHPELLVVEMDVSRTKIHLDTSISATSNSGRREYKSSIWNLIRPVPECWQRNSVNYRLISATFSIILSFQCCPTNLRIKHKFLEPITITQIKHLCTVNIKATTIQQG